MSCRNGSVNVVGGGIRGNISQRNCYIVISSQQVNKAFNGANNLLNWAIAQEPGIQTGYD